jgi:WD40 repeat protein
VLLAFVGAIPLVVVWYLRGHENPQLVATLPWRPRFVDCVLLVPDGSIVACAGDGNVRLWDIGTGNQLWTIEPQGGGFHLHLAISPDGKLLATASARVVQTWAVDERREIATLQADGDEINTVAISPDGKTLVSGGDDGVIRMWEIPSYREKASVRDQGNHIYSLAISADSPRMAWHLFPDTIRVYDFTEERVICNLRHQHPTTINAVAINADGSTVAVGSSGTSEPAITLWDVATKNEYASLPRKSGNIGSLVFCSTSVTLIAGCGGPRFLSDDPGRVEIWQVDTRKLRARWKTHDKWLVSVSISADNRTLATLCSDGAIRIWDVGKIQY